MAAFNGLFTFNSREFENDITAASQKARLMR